MSVHGADAADYCWGEDQPRTSAPHCETAAANFWIGRIGFGGVMVAADVVYLWMAR